MRTDEWDVPNSESAVELQQASQIKIQPIRWLWPGWLAQGKLHILAGMPGTGKTTIAMAMASTVSTGGCFPCGSQVSLGNVLVWTGEDDPSDTLVPRLVASGADLSRVYFVVGTRDDGKTRAFDPARDVGLLTQQAQQIGNVKLLIVDPVVSAVAGDGHKSNEVRRGLQPLVEIGTVLDCAVLGITHFSKGSAGRDPLERVTGSQAFGALARVVMVAAKDAAPCGDAPPRRFIARAKSNIDADGGGFDYAMQQVELTEYPGVTASYVEWHGALTGSARQLLGVAEREMGEDDGCTERNDAKAFLLETLADGPVPVKLLKSDGIGAGYGWRTLERAKKEAGIIARKAGLSDGWVWELSATDEP